MLHIKPVLVTVFNNPPPSADIATYSDRRILTQHTSEPVPHKGRTFCLQHPQPLRLVLGNLSENVHAFGVGTVQIKEGKGFPAYLPEAVHGVVSTCSFIVGARHFPGRDEALERLKLSSAVGLGT